MAAIDTETPRTPDYELTKKAAEGDMTAFEELYQRHSRRVYSLCLRMTGTSLRPKTSRRKPLFSSSER